MADRDLPFHEENTVLVHAPVDRVFAHLDDPKALAAHMGESSMMMAGSRMAIEVDANGGRVIGSKIRMEGSMLGVGLSLDEVITERQAPFRKVWQTVGHPRLLVIAQYRMGFELTPQGASSLVRVFIDFSLPATSFGYWLSRLFAGVYARWCVRRMAVDARNHFNAG